MRFRWAWLLVPAIASLPMACGLVVDLSGYELARSDGGTPDVAVDTTVIDSFDATEAAPDTSIVDTAVIDVADTLDTFVPDTSMPDTFVPDTFVPDTFVPDTFVPDTFVPDTFVPDTSMPDTFVPDTFVPDTSMPDTFVPDTLAPDGEAGVAVGGTCGASGPYCASGNVCCMGPHCGADDNKCVADCTLSGATCIAGKVCCPTMISGKSLGCARQCVPNCNSAPCPSSPPGLTCDVPSGVCVPP